MKQLLSSQADALAVRVDIGPRAYLCRPFAMPLLPGPSMAAALDTQGGNLHPRHGLHDLGRALHHEAGMCTQDQALYVFPRLIDASTLGCLVTHPAQQLITEAMLHDYWKVFEGGQSQLARMIPPGSFSSLGLAFVLGMVFTDLASVAPPQLPEAQTWIDCGAGACVGDLLEELAIPLAKPWGLYPLANPPAPLLASLLQGFEACVRSADRDQVGLPWMRLQDSRAVIHMGDECRGLQLDLPRDALSEQSWTELLTRLDLLAAERLAEPSA